MKNLRFELNIGDVGRVEVEKEGWFFLFLFLVSFMIFIKFRFYEVLDSFFVRWR